MTFPRYPDYKDSGVEWLGEVPAHWNVIAIKWLSPVLRGASPRPIDDPKYFDDDGEYAWVRIADVSASDGVLQETTQRLSELGSSLSVKLEPGELFVSIAGTIGKPCVSAIKACIHDGFVYFPRLEINPRLFYRIFESGTCYGGLGKWGTQLNLNTDTIGSIRIALPPSKELEQVLSFLDRETAKIDALIAEQQRLIELLKEKRQAVISHAVTKGLNPDAPMKDSGIEWLGEVPAHWEVIAAKRVASVFVPQRNKPELNIEENGVYWATMDDMKNTEIHQTSLWVSKEAAENAGSRILNKGAIIASCVGNFGVASINTVDLIINQQLQAYIPKPTIKAEFFRYFIGIAKVYFEQVGTAATLTYVNQQGFENLPIVLPSLVEQEDLISYLDNEIAKLDALTTEAQRAIDLLKERRTALISAAVTGKIDVRGLT
jgi:type I restriction enzyme S subunit